MPIEIKELVVKATVVENNRDGATAREGGSAGAGATEGLNKQQLIEECVEQVLLILERKKER